MIGSSSQSQVLFRTGITRVVHQILTHRAAVRTYNYPPQQLSSSSQYHRLTRPNSTQQQLRLFQTEGDFHNVADETLHTIQDSIEALLEEQVPGLEVEYSSGVLTMHFPPHGIWVINKQTPNQQLWWSSPLSGPRRYEYNDNTWRYTRSDGVDDTLGEVLSKEIKELYQLDLELAGL